MQPKRAVSRTIIADIWAAFCQACQQQVCGQVGRVVGGKRAGLSSQRRRASAQQQAAVEQLQQRSARKRAAGPAPRAQKTETNRRAVNRTIICYFHQSLYQMVLYFVFHMLRILPSFPKDFSNGRADRRRRGVIGTRRSSPPSASSCRPVPPACGGKALYPEEAATEL